jgi:plastocyanin
MKISNRLLGALAGILLLLVLTGFFNSCKKDSTSPSTSGNNVTMQNSAFSPSSITVSVNSTVTWTNKDSYAHTVTSTSSNETYDSGNINAGGTYSHKFTTAGTYSYKCTLHSGMTGTVVVK